MSISALMQVLTADPFGKQGFERVFMFSHSSEERMTHVTLTTQGNFSLSMTVGHYIWVTKARDSCPSIVRAGDVHVEDAAWIYSSATIVADKIVAIAMEEKTGLYNPHTPSGSIVVNGVAALTFTETIPSSRLWHAIITMPARILFDILPLRVGANINAFILSAYFSLPTHVRAAGLAIAATASISSYSGENDF